MRTLIAAIAISVSLIACEGPMGPEGPQGPAGPQGPQGDPTAAYFAQGILSTTGGAVVNYEGLDARTSTVNCWISDGTQVGGNILWLKVANSAEANCGVYQDGNRLRVVVTGPAGWHYMVVVIDPVNG